MITQRKAPLEWYSYYYGLPTDTKPTGVPIGSVFIEVHTDTGKGYRYETYDGDNWVLIATADVGEV
ncbi:MAG: hypothetical protein WDA59_04040 [Methanofastidiosum sp.]